MDHFYDVTFTHDGGLTIHCQRPIDSMALLGVIFEYVQTKLASLGTLQSELENDVSMSGQRYSSYRPEMNALRDFCRLLRQVLESDPKDLMSVDTVVPVLARFAALDDEYTAYYRRHFVPMP